MKIIHIRNVLSLFDGISCGQVALERAGITYDNYYASEIDNYAIQITQKNYLDTIQLGDVRKWEEWNIDWASIDLLIGGSPCQGFSFCGKQLNFEDERSKLFFQYVDILNHIRKYNKNIRFLLENVSMKKEYQKVISDSLGVNPMTIDSRIITPMRRKRLYWFNWEVGGFTQTNKKLIDILDSTVDNKYYLKQPQFDKLTYFENDELYIKNQPNKKMKVYIGDGVSLSRTWQQYMPIIRQESHCIRAANPDDIGVVVNTTYGLMFRKFTRSEMEKMQTLPIGYTLHDNITERKSKGAIGNGWTVDVIVHFFSFIK